MKGNILERSRVLPPTNPSRAVNSAHGTTRIAVSTTVRHTFGTSVGINVNSTGNGRYGRTSNRGYRRTTGIDRRSRWEVVK